MPRRFPGDAPVEVQPVAAAVKGHGGFPQHLLLQRGAFRRGNVGRIADNQVKAQPLHCGEQVTLVEGDPRAQRLGIPPGDCQRFRGQIRRVHLRSGQRQRHGHGDAPAAAA